MERYCTCHVFLFIECPIGHFGRNCSNKCSPPNSGYLCGQECASYCKTCHYIFGCTITTETKGKLYEFTLVIMRVFCFQRKTYFFLFGFSYKRMLSPAKGLTINLFVLILQFNYSFYYHFLHIS